MRGKAKWVAGALALVLLLSAGAALFLENRPSGTVAEIYKDGRLVRSIDLSAVTEAETFSVSAPGEGFNRITVEPGRICVSESDCRNQNCRQSGWMSGGSRPIVCLPNRLVIKMAGGESGVDAVAG